MMIRSAPTPVRARREGHGSPAGQSVVGPADVPPTKGVQLSFVRELGDGSERAPRRGRGPAANRGRVQQSVSSMRVAEGSVFRF